MQKNKRNIFFIYIIELKLLVYYHLFIKKKEKINILKLFDIYIILIIIIIMVNNYNS